MLDSDVWILPCTVESFTIPSFLGTAECHNHTGSPTLSTHLDQSIGSVFAAPTLFVPIHSQWQQLSFDAYQQLCRDTKLIHA